uniref:Uncharacterized protein n=1 Tax=Oryza rufipogon TaxID=4529 RepID=A0A0E0QXU5_ORYRU
MMRTIRKRSIDAVGAASTAAPTSDDGATGEERGKSGGRDLDGTMGVVSVSFLVWSREAKVSSSRCALSRAGKHPSLWLLCWERVELACVRSVTCHQRPHFRRDDSTSAPALVNDSPPLTSL